MKFKIDQDRTFVTSDCHVNHVNILQYCRGAFASTVEDMNDMLTQRWNDTVSPTDDVIILGDIVMGKRSESLEIVKTWHGNKFLVPGNHDNVHPMFAAKKNFQMMVEMYQAAGIVILPPVIQIVCDDITFDACHFPFDGDHTGEVRFQEWRPKDSGNWLLHGHVHGTGSAVGDRQIDVGVDAHNMTPVSMTDIVRLASLA